MQLHLLFGARLFIWFLRDKNLTCDVKCVSGNLDLPQIYFQKSKNKPEPKPSKIEVRKGWEGREGKGREGRERGRGGGEGRGGEGRGGEGEIDLLIPLSHEC